MSRILIWSPNYAPELTGIPPLVTEAAEYLVGHGHSVEVIAPVPNYPSRLVDPNFRGTRWMTEEVRGVRVHRHWLRVRPGESFLDKALYELTSSSLALRFGVPGMAAADVTVCVVPTVMAAAYAAALPRRGRLVLWVQDIVSIAAASVRGVRGAGIALASVRRAETFSARRADGIIVCSPGFRDYYTRLGIDPSKIVVIYNWADTGRFRDGAAVATNSVPPNAGRLPTFLYAGNVGYTQGLSTLVSAAALAEGALAVEIVGTGNAIEEISALAADMPNVSVRPPVPALDYPALLASATAHVVIQRRVSVGANFPSKIANYMASGRPIIASLPLESPAAQVLRESGGALLVEPESPTELKSAMVRLASDQNLCRDLGIRAQHYAERHFARGVALARLELFVAGGR